MDAEQCANILHLYSPSHEPKPPVNRNAARTTALPLGSTPELSTPRILVVDDNESIRIFRAHFFRLEGLPVEIIESPHLALKRFTATPHAYSMLLTDCEMPGMSGLELAKRIRRERADLPMILFSTSVTVLGPARFVSAGFSAALCKPVPLDTLRSTIREVLAIAVPPSGSPPA